MSSDPQDALKKEIERIAAELNALPLNNNNRLQRLKLNDLKRQREAELKALAEQALTQKLAELHAELKALPRGPQTQERRTELGRAVSDTSLELDLLRRRTT